MGFCRTPAKKGFQELKATVFIPGFYRVRQGGRILGLLLVSSLPLIHWGRFRGPVFDLIF